MSKASRVKNVHRQFDIGDRVRCSGEPHMDEHAGVTGTVMLINGNAYGICFDGMADENPHKWYVDNELELVEEENQINAPGMSGYTARLKLARPLAKLRQGKTDWYRFKNLASGATEVSIYDEIGYFGVTAKDFINDLNAVKSKKITLRLNSPGGEVFDGVAIYNALANHPSTIDVHIDGLAASIASVIAMAGDTITMAATASMMIHDGFGMVVGNAADMRETAELLDKVSNNIASIYAARTGTDADTWRARMRQETWYSADEAKAAGLADAVTPRKKKPGSEPQPDETYAQWDLSIFSPRNTATGIHHTATEDSPWDGPAAEAAMPNDEATLRYTHAWYDPAGDPDAKSTYKFPHHRTKGGPANLGACRNGLARLSNSKIPESDKAGVKAHLQAHLDDANKKARADIDFEFDPDTFREIVREALS